MALAALGTVIGLLNALRARGLRPMARRRLWLTEIGATCLVLVIPVGFLQSRISEPLFIAVVSILFSAGVGCLIASERMK